MSVRALSTLLLCLLAISGCMAPTGNLELTPLRDDAELEEAFGADDEAGPARDDLKTDFGPPTTPLGSMDWYNDPARISEDYERRFDALPLSGRAARTPWTDTYWPSEHRGIARRWQTPGEHANNSPDLETARQMTPEEIALLSPAEKYDLYVGAYGYPLTHRAVAETSDTAPSWHGYCHGWTPAAIHFDEPQPVTVTNADGIEIRFGSSDIKALLSYFQGEVVRSRYTLPFLAETRTMGSLCRSHNATDISCFDTNPGALHIVMANELGLRQQAFGIDAENTRQKWNQPVHHFESVVLAERAPNEGADPRAVRELVIRSEITWTQEIEATWEPVLETPHHSDTTRVHSYTLELDAEGTIVGGQWVLLLESGEVMTFHEVFRYFQELDENNDGQPDLDDRQASEQVFRYFEFPDYVWTQERGVFSDNFQIPPSEYSLVGSTRTSRGELYDYMGRLGELL